VVRGKRGKPEVRFAIQKPIAGEEGARRLNMQRKQNLALGLAEGNTEDPNHFQAHFGLLHQGL
jgi:hypothetical protein